MSIKTTHLVTREFAIRAIRRKKLSDRRRIRSHQQGKHFSELTDSEIEDLLEVALSNRFYNFRIVTPEELKMERESEFGCYYLDDIDNLPQDTEEADEQYVQIAIP